MFIAKSRWSALRLLVFTTAPSGYWALTGTLPGYLAAALFWGDPEALGLWVSFIHMLQQIINGVEVEAGQVIMSEPGQL